jgi:class 3 adenylate cyclase
VIEEPETRYAETRDGVHIAYQVWGNGPLDLLVLSSSYPSVDTVWEAPGVRPVLERLGALGRTMLLDRRGWGSSDALTLDARRPSLDRWVEDISAVLEAVGSNDQVAVIGLSEGGTVAMFYTATLPERVSHLVLFNSYARFLRDPDYPCGMPPELAQRYVAAAESSWGTMKQLETLAPSMVGNERWCRWFMRAQRLGGSPATAMTFFRTSLETNLHHVVPSIQVPTLIVHRRGNRHVRIDHGRYLAEHIPGSIFHELDGEDHLFFTPRADDAVDEIEEFLTGVRPSPVLDRVLATVLFTDIVGSTEQAARLGDRRWRELLNRYDELVQHHLERFRGRHIKSTGDGTLATFDGPARAVECARAIGQAVSDEGLDIRCGLHTGEVEARGEDVVGMAVHIAARIADLGSTGEVMVSSTVKDLVAGSGIEFTDRGVHELKGVPGSWKLLAVSG